MRTGEEGGGAKGIWRTFALGRREIPPENFFITADHFTKGGKERSETINGTGSLTDGYQQGLKTAMGTALFTSGLSARGWSVPRRRIKSIGNNYGRQTRSNTKSSRSHSVSVSMPWPALRRNARPLEDARAKGACSAAEGKRRMFTSVPGVA
jgi:hypothetical protein